MKVTLAVVGFMMFAGLFALSPANTEAVVANGTITFECVNPGGYLPEPLTFEPGQQGGRKSISGFTGLCLDNGGIIEVSVSSSAATTSVAGDEAEPVTVAMRCSSPEYLKYQIIIPDELDQLVNRIQECLGFGGTPVISPITPRL